MPRNLGTIPRAWLEREKQIWFYFLKMTWPAPLGILRWTSYPQADVFNADVDGAAQDWDCSHSWAPGGLDQGINSALSISDFAFAQKVDAVDDQWSQWLYTYGGVGDTLFTVWLAAFDPATEIIEDAIVVYDGKGDSAQNEDIVHVTLQPNNSLFGRRFPRRRYTKGFGFNWIPPANDTFPWGGIQASAPPSPPPSAGGPGGGSGGLPPGNIGSGSRTVVTVTPRGSPPTIAPRPTRGGTTTITR